MTLYVLPVTILEIVWVTEKVYGLNRKTIRELVEAILNTPELKCPWSACSDKPSSPMRHKGSNSRMRSWATGVWRKGLPLSITYDEKDFKRIPGLQVRKP